MGVRKIFILVKTRTLFRRHARKRRLSDDACLIKATRKEGLECLSVMKVWGRWSGLKWKIMWYYLLKDWCNEKQELPSKYVIYSNATRLIQKEKYCVWTFINYASNIIFSFLMRSSYKDIESNLDIVLTKPIFKFAHFINGLDGWFVIGWYPTIRKPWFSDSKGRVGTTKLFRVTRNSLLR